MLPKDIVDIILKYQNFYEVEEINKSVKNIIKQLKQINNNISEQLYMLMDGIEVQSPEYLTETFSWDGIERNHTIKKDE